MFLHNTIMYTIEYTASEGYVKPDLEGGMAWIEELLSGKYKQGMNRLKKCVTPPEYCCLGVKCEIDGLFVKELEIDEGKTIISAAQVWHHMYSSGVLPDGHPWKAEWQGGMQFPKGFLLGFKENKDDTFRVISLVSELNDRGVSFVMLAHVIQAAWNCI